MNQFLSTIEYVVKNSQNVSINHNEISSFTNDCNNFILHNNLQLNDFHFTTEEDCLYFLFLFHSINFCFWKEPVCKYVHKDRTVTGSLAALYILQKAVKEKKIPKTIDNLVNLKEEEMKNIFTNDENEVSLSLMQDRFRNIREYAIIMKYCFEGSIDTFLTRAGNSVEKFIKMTVKWFPSFDDVSFYKNKKVYFYKRVQALIYMIHNNTNYKFHDIDLLTAFADYRVPQILKHLKILKYSNRLQHIIDNNILIDHNTDLEIEIRAHTIKAVELIKNEYQKTNNKRINAACIDNYLWHLSQTRKEHLEPHHKTISVYY
jgi:hypothetical protein